MVDEDPRSKKSKFIEAYLGQREEEHQKAYSQPASTRPVEPTMAYPWSKPLPKHEERPQPQAETTSQHVSIRDLALKRAKPYLRPDQDAQEEPRPSLYQKHEPSDTKYQSLFANKRPGFKLVKETADMKQAPDDPKRKRLCLYDLYAPRIPHDEECRPVEHHESHREEPIHVEAPVKQVREEEPAPVVMSDQEREEVREVADSLLWGPKKKTTPKPGPTDKPILKVGPAKVAPIIEPEPEVEVPPHEEEKTVEDVRPEVEGPQAETAQEKGAGGELCPSCGAKYTDHLVPQICTSCGTVRCTKCNNYEHEHVKTSIYYDYKFEWPLCIACYSKAYNIQKTMSKAMTCFGNGNLTYAVYYAQNAIRMDPTSKYAEDAAKLIQRVDEAKVKKEAMDKAWKVQSQKLTRAKFQDPGWQQKKA